MNNQGDKGVEWTHVFGPRTGETWNVVGGCFHGCRWEMPDGTIAECYAETIAEGLARSSYPDGFAHHYWHPARLEEPLRVREPRGIFLDSMSDLMGHWVSDEQIRAVLDVVRRADWHIFFLLTKNAPRLLKFKDEFPPNLWVGVSMPPTEFMGKKLTLDQQIAYMNRALDVLNQLSCPVRWMSLEPLSFDVWPIFMKWIQEHRGGIKLPFNWVVIGAASNRKETFQPEPMWVRNLLFYLFDPLDIPVFFKGNLEWDEWREEFPVVSPVAMSYTQSKMFAGA